jgi:DNA-directed RNA polymerase subunit beta'
MAKIFDNYGTEMTVKTADRLKDLSFEYETIASISTCKDDYPTYDKIQEFIAEGDSKTAQIQDQYNQGLLTDDERYKLTVQNWRNIDNEISAFLKDQLSEMDTDIAVMTNSGARGSVSNIKLASAEVGIMVDINNNEIELPVKSSFKKGLTTLESFIATRGARQGQVSTALRTADSGYLTRRLVDVAQDVFTTSEEAPDPGFEIFRNESEYIGIDFAQRLAGRYTAENVPGYIDAGELITKEIADQIAADENVESVKIQSVLTTTAVNGIPQKAYGIDMSTRELVAPDEPVGVIAAQSLGEPGTQLTLDTKHGSGVAGSGAIARGLPRVEELLEARNPKGQAWVAPISGVCEVWEDGNHYVIQINPIAGKTTTVKLEGRKARIKDGASVKAGDVIADMGKGADPIIAAFDATAQLVKDGIVLTETAGAPVKVEVPNDSEMKVKTNDEVEAGDKLTEGSLNLQDQLKYKGAEATARYIMNDVTAVYAAQGHEISSKHLEIIVRQMFSRVMIDESGDSEFVIGDIVSLAAVIAENERLEAEGKKPAEYTRLLLGISKVSINSDSFLSAASFQDTTRVLINAAINGRVDRLHGLKENVIIGRKIPVGTGKHPIESMDPAEAAAREEARERGEEYVPESTEVEAEVENA